jgi:hypothetical protein
LPTGEKDDANQIIPFLKFLFILVSSILRVSSRILRELQMFNLFQYIFMARVLKLMLMLKTESGCLFVSVRDWMIVWEKVPEVACVVGWVWGMVETIFFQLGKCFVNKEREKKRERQRYRDRQRERERKTKREYIYRDRDRERDKDKMRI